MSLMKGLPPSGGDYDRGNEVHAFTWTLECIAIIFVAARMYSRVKLTRNVWWDDWCICAAQALDLVISIMWSVYAGRGYARHLYYISPAQLPDIIKLNTISRTLCILSIAIGKVSVAFMIERIAGPGSWRKWMLRGISISIMVSACITVLLFYIQCQPARALWDKGLIKEGKGHCWDPIPINTWNLVIASYWAFLDFALAFIPVDIVWKLQLSKEKKLLLSLLLSMGVFAGIAAAVKTSKIPISVKSKKDITWDTVELLMWNGIEMNVIIIAACIPTLRPLCLILFRQPGASQYRPSMLDKRSRSYQKTAGSNDSANAASSRGSRGSTLFTMIGNKTFKGNPNIDNKITGNSMLKPRKRSIVVNEAAVMGSTMDSNGGEMKGSNEIDAIGQTEGMEMVDLESAVSVDEREVGTNTR